MKHKDLCIHSNHHNWSKEHSDSTSAILLFYNDCTTGFIRGHRSKYDLIAIYIIRHVKETLAREASQNSFWGQAYFILHNFDHDDSSNTRFQQLDISYAASETIFAKDKN